MPVALVRHRLKHSVKEMELQRRQGRGSVISLVTAAQASETWLDLDAHSTRMRLLFTMEKMLLFITRLFKRFLSLTMAQ